MVWNIIETAKIFQEMGKIEEYRQILELNEKLLVFQSENIRLKEENKILSERLELTWKLEFKNNAYFKDWENQPYCSCCWESEKKLISMIIYWDYSDCPKCKLHVNFTWVKNRDNFSPNRPKVPMVW